jgi:hypothetical protein
VLDSGTLIVAVLALFAGGLVKGIVGLGIQVVALSLLTLSLDVDNDTTGGAVETSIYEIERRIKTDFPDVTRLFIEVQSAADYAETVWSGDIGTPRQ